MFFLVLGLLIFLGAHSVRIVAEPWRNDRISRMGEARWKGLYSVVSLAGLVLIVWGYGQARLDPVVVWNPPLWTRHAAAALLIPAFILVVAGNMRGTRMKRTFGHPMVLGVKLWAFAHLLANGMLADVVLFGSFLIWAVFDYRAARRRDRAMGVVYPPGALSKDAIAVVIGIVAWVAFAFWLHLWLFGVRPLGV